MNLARIEYYFSDFLTILQEPDHDKWLIELVSSDMRTLPMELPEEVKQKMRKDDPTVVSGQGKSKACFATLAERKTRLYLAMKIPDRKADTMAAALVKMLSAFPNELVKTITCDRGAEFASWQTVEKELHCDVYFADPYCAWQKGTNENSNGLLREFYPKGRNLSRVSPKTLLRYLALINARPRKVLHFHSAQELWDEELRKVLHFS